MALVFKNNASTTITNNPLTNVGTSVTVTDGSVFPTATTDGDYFYATLIDGSTKEIVKVTNRSTNTLTVVRAQEGTGVTPDTIGVEFPSGSRIELRLTNQSLEDLKTDTFYRMYAIQNEEGAIGHGI